MKTIGILGSTGSIGQSCFALLENELQHHFAIDFISFHYNANLAFKQAVKFNIKNVIATSKQGYENFKKLSINYDINLKYGGEELKNACQNSSIEVILIAIVGFCGLEFTLSSIVKSKRILAIANKESIVCGFHLIKQKLQHSQTTILPVDSEHNSLYRLLNTVSSNVLKKAFITASGGPFCGSNFNTLKNVNIKEVISHPSWQMGAKISVDSASMANKGLELIEAYNLFNLPKIDVFISKGSLLHSGITLQDGSSQWFLSKPDMKLHIAHSILNEQIEKLNIPEINLQDIQNIQCLEVKQEEFPIFFIAKKIAESKNILGAISFNILNDIAVYLFLEGKIQYTQILNIIEDNLLFNPSNFEFKSVEEIQEYSKQLQAKINL